MPGDSRADVAVYVFCKWDTSALFDIQIVNLDAGSYLPYTSVKDQEMAEKEKKYKYLQPCLERRQYFNPMVYSADEIIRTEAVSVHQYIASLLSIKLKWEYYEIYGFVRDRMSLERVISNTLLLQGAREKETYIC